jgi:hypothetical protein
MSRNAEITLDWADGTYLFALKWAQIIELQEQLDAGPYFVLSRLSDGTWRAGDISHVIRLGLIGGGMEPVAALKKVRTYVEDRPPIENIIVAQAVLSAGVIGAPDEPEEPAMPEKQNAGEGTETTLSRAAKSDLPPSSKMEPPSD